MGALAANPAPHPFAPPPPPPSAALLGQGGWHTGGSWVFGFFFLLFLHLYTPERGLFGVSLPPRSTVWDLQGKMKFKWWFNGDAPARPPRPEHPLGCRLGDAGTQGHGLEPNICRKRGQTGLVHTLLRGSGPHPLPVGQRGVKSDAQPGFAARTPPPKTEPRCQRRVGGNLWWVHRKARRR